MSKQLLILIVAVATAVGVCTIAAPQAIAQPAYTTRVAFIGDSITNCYGVPTSQCWATRFENRQTGDNILPIGVNGATARRWLQQYLPQLDQLRTWRPKTVVIALGGNEYHMTRPPGEYADHLRQLNNYVRNLVPGVPIVMLHYYRITKAFEPNGCDAPPGNTTPCLHSRPPATWDEYGAAMRSTAAQVGATYVDISKTRDWSPYQFDQAHLNAEGNRLYDIDVYAALYWSILAGRGTNT